MGVMMDRAMMISGLHSRGWAGVLVALFALWTTACGDGLVEVSDPESGAGQTSELGNRSPHIGVACNVQGQAGTCQEVTHCTGDFVATPGYCPGPSGIQCCTPTRMPSMPPGQEPSEPPVEPMEEQEEEEDVVVMPESPYVGGSCSVQGQAGTCEEVSTCVGDFMATPGHCPGPAGIQCCTPTQMSSMPPEMMSCDETGAPPPSQSLTEAPGTGGCPDGMVRVASFCVDQYEASLAIVQADGSLQSWSPYFNPGTRPVHAISVAKAIPQGYINANQAEAACQRSGKRLCTDNEWLRACRGSSDTLYPYGNTRQPGVCNDARSRHPAIEYFGTDAGWIWHELDNACINQQADTVVTGDSHPGCITDEGVHHMMGNMHEWISDSGGIFRGGFYADTRHNGDGCEYDTEAHNRSHWDYSTGFRCCADLP